MTKWELGAILMGFGFGFSIVALLFENTSTFMLGVVIFELGVIIKFLQKEMVGK